MLRALALKSKIALVSWLLSELVWFNLFVFYCLYLTIFLVNISQTKVIFFRYFNFLTDLVEENLTFSIFLQQDE